MAEDKEMGEITGKDKFYATLSYLSPFPFLIIPFFAIPLIFKRKNLWIIRHAKQGTMMFLLLLAVGWIPVIGWAIDAVFLIFWILAIVSVARGKFFKIPIAGSIGDKLDI
jgi:uncharacterized membrane protein